MKITGILFFLFISFYLHASTVDTVTIFSHAMKQPARCVVIKPDSYKKKKNRFPTVYLLHGYAGSYSNWVLNVPQIRKYADDHQVLIVCPDGSPSSWYIDSPIDSSRKYETYIAKEVVAYIDANYRTLPGRNARAITGLSMGGHGALYIAFKNSGLFGACGSMSGVMNLLDSRNRYELVKRIGDTSQIAEWKKFSMVYLAEKKPADSLAILFDCGIRDAFIGSNRKLHETMLASGIAHEYTERPGQHDWNYWANAVAYHLLFFRKYFDAMKTLK